MPQDTQQVDYLIIGAGSGGVRAARLAGAAGKKVAVVESGPLGGTCVNLGCIPKKLFYYAAHFSQDIADARSYGWTEARAGELSWPDLLRAKNTEIERLNSVYQQLLDNAGVQVVRGRAKLAGQGEVMVDDGQNGQRFRAERILIATGSCPVPPDFPGSELAVVSDAIFYLPQLPERLAVIGGGYIALEFAGIFNGMGRQTHLVYRGAPLLRGFDMGVREQVTREIGKKGVQLHLNTGMDRLEELPGGAGYRLHFTGGDHLDVDLVLAATGRRANTDGLDLASAGVATDANGYIEVDSAWRTSAEGIYALGDVIGTPQLTPLAIAQAVDLHHQLFAGAPRQLKLNAIPTAVFCQPQVGTVGLGEEEAVAEHGEVLVYESSFRQLKDTVTGSDEQMLVRLVVNAGNDRVLGAHLVGGEAGEIIQGLALGVEHGLSKRQFDQTLAVHPTAAEEFVTFSVAPKSVP